MEISNDALIQLFYSLVGLISVIFIVGSKLIAKLILKALDSRFKEMELKLEKNNLKRDKKDLEKDIKIKEDIANTIKDQLRNVIKDFNNSKDHAIKNLKHLIALFNQNIAYEYNKFEESSDKKIKEMQVIKEANGNKILSNIKKAND